MSSSWFNIIIFQALTSPKKQLESLSVSSLIHKKQSTHNSFYITVCIVLTSIIKNISYPRFVVVATTSSPAQSSCLMKIAYMLNVNMPMLLSSYEKYIYSFKIH
ncbi:hypothetical protein IGI04_039851 [Brassica rapa subsp. trilocularis]|uniref:Uncharacterized protein n=1 Tax=Brassica rapa subsp. trilocularis TaxID=1813537 RepID=A0ABQ7KL34_BRACM|nr:hypothetical protein IGI04_039851 [Brassica rapa subsp. trilocularis]